MEKLTRERAKRPLATHNESHAAMGFAGEAMSMAFTITVRGDDDRDYVLSLTPAEMLQTVAEWLREASSTMELTAKVRNP